MNWIMVKGLTVFVCGLALFGLAACGGGGDDPPASDKPEMTIIPPADHPNTLADAAPIMDGQTVTGVIDSPDDVDFFRLPVTEDSRVGFMLDAEAGLEIALLDSEGNALDIGETESVVRVGAAVIVRGAVIAGRGVAFARVNCGSSLVAARRCVKKSFKLLATAQTYRSSVKAVIEFLRGVPTLELSLGVARVEQKIDLTRYLAAYSIGDRNPLPYTVTSIKVPALGLSMRVDGSKVATVAATPDVEPGKYRITAAIEVLGTEGVVKIRDDHVRTVVRRIFDIIIEVRKRTSGNGQDPTPPPQGPTTPPGSGVGLIRNGSCLAISGVGTCPTSGSEFKSIFECKLGVSGQFSYYNEATSPSFYRQVCERSGGTFIIHKGA